VLRPGSRFDTSGLSVSTDIALADIGSPANARSWVDEELANLLAVAEQAAGLASQERWIPLGLCNAVWYMLHVRLEWRIACRFAELALGAAEREEDLDMTGQAHLMVGRSLAESGDLDGGTRHHENALTAFRQAGSQRGVATALNGLGVISVYRKEPTVAMRYMAECLQVAQRHDLRSLEAAALMNHGEIFALLGRWEDAKDYLERALAIRREQGATAGVTSAVGNLAAVYLALGNLDDALRCATEAVAGALEMGDLFYQGNALVVLAELHLRAGRVEDSVAVLDDALTLARTHRHRYIEAACLRQYSRAMDAVGRRHAAAETSAHADRAFANPNLRRDFILEALFTTTPHELVLAESA
jgi:tetratricopeptide (TPR) repeat protein